MQRTPTLIGLSGHVKGERFPLEYGKKIVVGRSREADISLRRMSKWVSMNEEQREKDESLRTVSGRHFEITMYNARSIEVVNLSSNGTLLDGKKVEIEIIDDINETAHVIRFGKEETFSLELAEAPEQQPDN